MFCVLFINVKASLVQWWYVMLNLLIYIQFSKKFNEKMRKILALN